MTTATPEATPQFPIAGLSHVQGWTDIPLSDSTIYGLLADTARCYPDRPAVVFREQGVRWTWAQFLAEVDAFGADHQRHAERDDADRRRLQQLRPEVRAGHEVLGEDEVEQQQHDDGDVHAVRLEPPGPL